MRQLRRTLVILYLIGLSESILGATPAPTFTPSPKKLTLRFTGLVQFVSITPQGGGPDFIRAVLPDFRDGGGLPAHFAYVRYLKDGARTFRWPTETSSSDSDDEKEKLDRFVRLGGGKSETLSLAPAPSISGPPTFDPANLIITVNDLIPNPTFRVGHDPNNPAEAGTAAYFDIHTGTLVPVPGARRWRLCTAATEDCFPTGDGTCFAQAVEIVYHYPAATKSIVLKATGGDITFDMLSRDEVLVEIGNAMEADIKHPMPDPYQYVDTHFLLYYNTLKTTLTDKIRLPFQASKRCGPLAKLHGSNCPPVRVTTFTVEGSK